MILSMYDTTVPLRCQRQREINCVLIMCKGKEDVENLPRFSASSDFPTHVNLKFVGGKLSKVNQPTGKICWSIGRLKLWASHSSRCSLSNSSKTSWPHAAFLALKVNVTISRWFISFLCTTETWQRELSFSVHAQHLSYLIPTGGPVLHHIVHRRQ